MSIQSSTNGLKGPNTCGIGYQYKRQSSMYSVQNEGHWALWMDSAWVTTIYHKSDTSRLSYTALTDPTVRWRWARIPTGDAPWVRWTDTFKLGGPAWSGQIPLLTMRQPGKIDSIVPAEGNRPSPAFGQNLVIRLDTTDSAGLLSWSASKGSETILRHNPWPSLEPGQTLYVTSAATDSVGDHLWRIWSAGKVLDSFWIAQLPTAGTRSQVRSPLRSGTGWSIDGRPYRGATGSGLRFEVGKPIQLEP
ncbi:MAG: hypothetical protein RL173_1262 [Fibrobacterota bacterium]